MRPKRGYTVEGNARVMLRDAGIDVGEVLRRANLPDDLLNHGAVTLSNTEYYRLWYSLEETVGSREIALIVSRGLAAESFSPAIFAAMCSPNFSIAVGRIARFKPLIAPVVLHIDNDPGVLRVTIEWIDDEPSPPATLQLTELAFFVALARFGTREHVVPVRASAPDTSPVTEEYRDFLGVTVERGPSVSVSFTAKDADRPFLTANEEMWETFAPELARRLADLDSGATMAERVSAVLLEYLPSGLGSIEAVAGKLIMSKRTLQRRLRNEGTSFQETLKNVRQKLAIHYLTDSDLTATEISYLIGFEDANSFFRAFSEWTGTTPTTIRASVSPVAVGDAYRNEVDPLR